MLISEYFSCVNYNPLVLEPLASFSLRPKFSSVRQLFPPVIFLPPILCVRTDGGRGQPIPPCPLLAIPTIWGGGGWAGIVSAAQLRSVPIAKHYRFQENLPHCRAFPNVTFLSNFRCRDEKLSRWQSFDTLE